MNLASLICLGHICSYKKKPRVKQSEPYRLLTTVKSLITDPPKSGQPLYSGWLTCPLIAHLILPQLKPPKIERLSTPNNGQIKIPPKTDSEATPT